MTVRKTLALLLTLCLCLSLAGTATAAKKSSSFFSQLSTLEGYMRKSHSGGTELTGLGDHIAANLRDMDTARLDRLLGQYLGCSAAVPFETKLQNYARIISGGNISLCDYVGYTGASLEYAAESLGDGGKLYASVIGRTEEPKLDCQRNPIDSRCPAYQYQECCKKQCS